jgi:hypothetical protein
MIINKYMDAEYIIIIIKTRNIHQIGQVTEMDFVRNPQACWSRAQSDNKGIVLMLI